MTRGRGLGEPSSLSRPLPGLNLSLSDPNQPPPSLSLSRPPQLHGVINESARRPLRQKAHSRVQPREGPLSQDSLTPPSSLYKSE